MNEQIIIIFIISLVFCSIAFFKLYFVIRLTKIAVSLERLLDIKIRHASRDLEYLEYDMWKERIASEKIKNADNKEAE